jgi:hypothetical protein
MKFWGNLRKNSQRQGLVIERFGVPRKLKRSPYRTLCSRLSAGACFSRAPPADVTNDLAASN